MGSKMMKFQNKRVREGWIVVCYYCLRRMEKYGNFKDMGSKIMIF